MIFKFLSLQRLLQKALYLILKSFKYLITSIVLISTVSISQNNIDSLVSKLEDTSGIPQIDLLNEISEAFFQIDSYDEAAEYSDKAVKGSVENGYQKGEIKAYNNLARINLSIREVSSALEFAQNALNLAEEVDDKNENKNGSHEI